MFKECMQRVNEKQDFSMLKDLHMILCSQKASYTNKLLLNTEVCRRACGGHGYLDYARFHDIFSEFAPVATYEGENTVLHLQAARFLVKAYEKSMKDSSRLSEYLAYVSGVSRLDEEGFEANSVSEFFSMEKVRNLLRIKSLLLIRSAGNKLMEGVTTLNMKPKDAWDLNSGVCLVEASNGFVDFFTFNCFQAKLSGILNDEIRKPLRHLCLLYGINRLEDRIVPLLEADILKGHHVRLLKEAKEELYRQLKD